MRIIIYLVKLCLNAIYSLFKLKKIKGNKVVFCSRQSDDITIDFQRIQEELKSVDSNLQFVTICSRWQGKKDGIMKLVKATLKSMYHMADARACVLDGYWPAACMLKHKKEFSIVQIWHSVGKFKMSGYQTLGNEYGRSATVAELCDMHKQYKYIISGGEAWNPFYCEAFNVKEDVLRNYGLPRLEDLIKKSEERRKKVLEQYPEFAEKKIVLYAPTFRKGEKIHWESMAEKFLAEDEYVFICKMHPNQEERGYVEGVYLCPEFNTLELLSSADFVITDYSSLALEAAALDKQLYFYLFDYDNYMSKNGLNFKIKEQLPTLAHDDEEGIFKAITSDDYDFESYERFKKEYLPDEPEKSAAKIAELIIGEMKEC
ncbi:MAG: CDP-glycerol glycerophosphotransferase family protein [Eubacterium sp.]|nr:CDP-glycerol glycerophosphotransferase family protein [Eubacterium sp.]